MHFNANKRTSGLIFFRVAAAARRSRFAAARVQCLVRRARTCNELTPF